MGLQRAGNSARPALFDPALRFDGFVGGGDAVEADAGLLLVVLAHVAHLRLEIHGHAAEGPWFLLDGYKLGAIHR